MEEKKVIVNGKEISEEELKSLKESLQENKGMQLVEISPGTYKTRLLG